MQPIYDKHGQPVGWLQRNNIYGLDGAHAAFLRGHNLHGHGGEHLGTLKEGFFRDLAGDCIAFMTGARGGPSQPPRAQTPMPPSPGAASDPASFELPPVGAVPSFNWSSLAWKEFLHPRPR